MCAEWVGFRMGWVSNGLSVGLDAVGLDGGWVGRRLRGWAQTAGLDVGVAVGLDAVGLDVREFPMAEEMVPIFRVADGLKSAEWYARLGFVIEGEHRFAPDLPLYLFLARGDLRLHLSEHLGDATPDSLVYLYVDDVDVIATEFGVSVEQQPWAREIALSDPDGNRLRIGQRD